MLIGIGLYISIQFGAVVALITMVSFAGAEFETSDIGDIFEKSVAIAEYADERLIAATKSTTLPDPPTILADLTTLKLSLASGIVAQAVLIALIIVISRQPTGQLLHRLQLTSYRPLTMWRAPVAAFGCYVMVFTYAVIVKALGLGPLEPQSTVPFEIVRDPLAIGLTGVAAVVGAPLTEELFFRGLVFGGLLRWGFWPAAVLSGALFSSVHLDLGSLIPFFIIGVVMAWLFWRRGNLWESISFHVCFNLTSFLLLLATEV